jgi:hypothetical protein
MLRGGSAADRAGVVDQNVDAPRGADLGCECLYSRTIREVDSVAREPAAGRGDRALDLAPCCLELCADADDVGAGDCQRLRHREANPAPASGYERDLAG